MRIFLAVMFGLSVGLCTNYQKQQAAESSGKWVNSCPAYTVRGDQPLVLPADLPLAREPDLPLAKEPILASLPLARELAKDCGPECDCGCPSGQCSCGKKVAAAIEEQDEGAFVVADDTKKTKPEPLTPPQAEERRPSGPGYPPNYPGNYDSRIQALEAEVAKLKKEVKAIRQGPGQGPAQGQPATAQPDQAGAPTDAPVVIQEPVIIQDDGSGDGEGRGRGRIKKIIGRLIHRRGG